MTRMEQWLHVLLDQHPPEFHAYLRRKIDQDKHRDALEALSLSEWLIALGLLSNDPSKRAIDFVERLRFAGIVDEAVTYIHENKYTYPAGLEEWLLALTKGLAAHFTEVQLATIRREIRWAMDRPNPLGLDILWLQKVECGTMTKEELRAQVWKWRYVEEVIGLYRFQSGRLAPATGLNPEQLAVYLRAQD